MSKLDSNLIVHNVVTFTNSNCDKYYIQNRRKNHNDPHAIRIENESGLHLGLVPGVYAEQ